MPAPATTLPETPLSVEHAAVHAVRDLRQRLDALESLLRQASDLPAEQPHTTTVVARELNLTVEALTSWARVHAPGSIRDGWQLIGRQPGRRAWWWRRVPPCHRGPSVEHSPQAPVTP